MKHLTTENTQKEETTEVGEDGWDWTLPTKSESKSSKDGGEDGVEEDGKS